MVQKIIRFYAILVLILAAGVVSAQQFDYVTYRVETDEDITIAWDAVPEATGYKWEFRNVDRGDAIVAQGETNQTSFTLKMPKTGCNVFEVKSIKRLDPQSTDYEESVVAASTDPEYATVDGQPRAWWICVWIEKPKGVVIE